MASNIPQIPVEYVDPILHSINQLFEHLHSCLEQRRLALITSYQEAQNDRIARLAMRARKIEELLKLKESTERDLQLNELNELQNRVLAQIEQKLAEVRAPQPDTRIVFRSESVPLEQLITDLGEVLEEEVVPLVPNYQTMKPVVAVGKRGRAPGELYFPNAVVVDSSRREFISITRTYLCVFRERRFPN